jgi:hypothetical protein
MTTKETAIKTIDELPEDASWEDIQERINFVVAIHKGLRELDAGKEIPHEKLKEEFAPGWQPLSEAKWMAKTIHKKKGRRQNLPR